MIIDQLKTFITSECNKFVKENNYLTKEYLDGAELKQKCKTSLETIYPFIMEGEAYNLSDKDFDEKFNTALRDVRYNFRTVMTPSISIRNEYSESWLTPERIDKIGWEKDKNKTYRGRYLEYLKKIGRSEAVVKETSRSSLEIIKKVGDPESSGDFFVKGLVVGSVQSGKTSNFNAVINSSVDVGYKLIIVLSGIMEDLRRQTQIRTEKEVAGKMITTDKFIGVGEIASFGPLGQFSDVKQVELPTSSQNDFNRTMLAANFNINNTNIFICKKNTSVLQNLLIWLKDYLSDDTNKHDIPFLIIDDEADNASINNLGHRGKEFANKINGHIRALLALFKKKTYIGYTATPFANVLQDWNKKPETQWPVVKNNNVLLFDLEDNLFPNDFIELLIPPSNYIGAKHFFETRIEEIRKIEPLLARPVTDHIEAFPERVEMLSDGSLVGVKKYNNKSEFDDDADALLYFGSYQEYRQTTRATTKYDQYPVEIPRSLDEAIKCFIISIAIRLARRPEMSQSKLFQRHHTMLIHISRFSDWQCRTKQLILQLTDKLQVSLNNDDLVSENSIYREFERIWNKYYEYAINNIREFLPNEYDDEYLSRKSFEEIKKYLIEAINGIEVKAVNTVEKDVLDYENEKEDRKYIVIGGNKLSRGFTLEGLTINYFLRNTNYADNLLQMGRWFGYRPGYLDCCKLFTTEDTFEKFDQTTWTIEELEEEFRQLSINRKKPKDYAIKVLTHPGRLQITRPAILKNAIVEKWSYADKLIQTTELKITQKTLDESWANFKNIYTKYQDTWKQNKDRNILYLETDTNGLTEFIESQKTYTDSFAKTPVLRYIQLCNEHRLLTNWTIAIKTSGKGNILPKEITGFIDDITLTQRSTPEKPTNPYYVKLLDNNIFKISGASSNILSGGKDMSFTLSDNEIHAAEETFKKKNPNKNIPERIYRERIKSTDGLMVIFLMDLKDIFNSDELKIKAEEEEGIDLEKPLIGFALGIPPLDATIGGEYLVNKHILDNIQNHPDEEEVDEDENNEDELEGIEATDS